MSDKNCSLIIDDLGLKVHLGATEKERSKKQKVLVNIKIDFSGILLACKTDKLSDAICYSGLAKKIEGFCCDKEFALIENLCMQLFLFVKEFMPKDSRLYLSVAKAQPLKNLKQSVFEISD